jgi:peptidyl-prolyl cis-trans isomerase SurA
MKGFKIIPFLMFSLQLGILNHPSLVSAEISNRVVAIVNSELVTLHELNTKIKELTGLGPDELRNQDEKRYLEARRNILDLLIDEKIAREKIRELGISMTPNEVDDAIEGMKRDKQLTHEDLMASLKRGGISYASYRENIKDDLERMQLINFEVKSRIIITDERIGQYYSEHEEEFSSEEKVHLAAILLKQHNPSDQDNAGSLNRQAEEIISRLENGEDFGKLAEEFSEGPGAEEGGDFGFFKTSQLDPELLKIVRELSVGDFSEPLIRPAGIQIVKLVERQERKLRPLDEVRDAIHGILYREEINKRYSSWIKGLREKAYVKIIF